MTDAELQDIFVMNLEIERARLGYSQKQMAKVLGLSHSRYKRIIYREVELHGVLLLAKLYDLTGKELTDLIGISDSQLDLRRSMSKLGATELQALKTVIGFLLSYQN